MTIDEIIRHIADFNATGAGGEDLCSFEQVTELFDGETALPAGVHPTTRLQRRRTYAQARDGGFLSYVVGIDIIPAAITMLELEAMLAWLGAMLDVSARSAPRLAEALALASLAGSEGES